MDSNLDGYLASGKVSGGCGGTALAQVDVAEVYSTPRVIVEAKKFSLRPGEAMDLRTGFDSNKPADRERAKQKIRESKPRLLIGSPECTMFSALQNLSGWTLGEAKKLQEAKSHMKFMCELYEEQVQQGRWIQHEHPVGATSWQLDTVKRL